MTMFIGDRDRIKTVPSIQDKIVARSILDRTRRVTQSVAQRPEITLLKTRSVESKKNTPKYKIYCGERAAQFTVDTNPERNLRGQGKKTSPSRGETEVEHPVAARWRADAHICRKRVFERLDRYSRWGFVHLEGKASVSTALYPTACKSLRKRDLSLGLYRAAFQLRENTAPVRGRRESVAHSAEEAFALSASAIAQRCYPHFSKSALSPHSTDAQSKSFAQ